MTPTDPAPTDALLPADEPPVGAPWRTVGVVGAVVAAVLEVASRVVSASEGAGVPPALVPYLVVSVVVALAGAVLLHRHDERGVAVLVTSAALTLPAVLANVPDVGRSPASQRLWLASGLVLLAAAGAAWAVRDRLRWSAGGAASVPYVAAAAAVLLGTLLPTTWFRAGSDGGVVERWWVPAIWDQGFDRSTGALLLSTVIVAALLWLGARLVRPLGAAVVGTLALTGTVAAAGNAAIVTAAPELWVTPVGWLHLAGNLVLLVLAGAWWSQVSGERDVRRSTDPTVSAR